MSEHNIFYYQDLMRDIRHAIEAQKFDEFARNFAQNYANNFEQDEALLEG